MAENKQKLLLELQMEELKATYGIKPEDTIPQADRPNMNRTPEKAKIAKLYEDAAEYEEDLRCFEAELQIIDATKIKDITHALNKEFPNYEGNYVEESKAVLEAGWTNLVEVEKTHPQEQLEYIKNSELSSVLEKLNTQYPNYSGNFEDDIKNILIKRWEMLIAIKKEHIKEELAEMKLRGMKPDHIRKVYNKFHGLE